GLNVLGGANADYFNMSTGVVLGPIIKDGLVCSSEHSSFEEIGFFGDGSAKMGRMGLNVEFTELVTGQVYSLMAYNKDLASRGGLVLFSSVFGSTNGGSQEGLNVLIKIEEGEARIGGTITGTVESVFESEGAVELDDEHLLLSVYLDTDYRTVIPILNAMSEGDGVTVSFSADPEWEDVTNALGGAERLIRDGEVCSLGSSAKNPRTAIGITEEGDVLLYTCDGRNAAHSAGLTLKQLAERLLDLGCVDAVNLDGGGSTQIHCVLPGYENDITVNKPSENRRCADYLMFAVPKEEPGEAENLWIYPCGEYLLAGSSLSFEAKATDGSHNPAELPEEPRFSSKMGRFEGNVFTAHDDADGEGTVKVSSGVLKSRTDIYIVSEPDSLKLYCEGKEAGQTVSVKEGEGLRFSAEAIFARLPVLADKEAFSWEISEGIGTLDQEGNYKAENITEERGTLTVSCAGVTAEVELTCDQNAPVIEFNEEEGILTALITDSFEGRPSSGRVSMTLDGKKFTSYAYDSEEGLLTADLTGLEPGLHHIIIKAADAAGNRTRSQFAVDIPSEEPEETVQPFSDMEGHWASDYASYLNKQGIFRGRGSDDAPVFAPDVPMTRQEFATVLIRWLGVDTEKYAETELPYTDLETIAGYALPAVRAAYALKYIEGKSRGEERFFDPKGIITRQDAMTIIGRSLEEGLGRADLSDFSDEASVASYARPYVEML
ncbi:MAG: phosphodiester glycosidase family protein, partial [Firmicutes bacterium]|nr:phosphodiester glycosidase family protein [Bacillota bacterium]